MNLAEVMDEVATRLDTITGLHVFGYEAGSISGETAFVGYPTEYKFDESYGRGKDRMKLPVVVCIPNPKTRTARDRLGKYCDGSGSESVKQVLESGTYTTFTALSVQMIEFEPVTINEIEYAGALFTLDIQGSGSS